MNLSVPQKAPFTALVNRVQSKLRRDSVNGTCEDGCQCAVAFYGSITWKNDLGRSKGLAFL